METIERLAAILAMILALGAAPERAGAQDPDQALHDWQVRRLMQPLPQEIEKEKAGSVYVYDGLTDREVEQALTNQFNRIQYMMFVGTKKTDANGQVKVDETTGQVQQESSGCASSE